MGFEPGVYDMPEDIYHADPVPGGSLSASGAKKILSSPARFWFDRLHPPKPTAAMELGTAAHKLTLGVGAQIVMVNAEDWRSAEARAERDQARAEGKVPLLRADYGRAATMAAAVRSHPLAAALFTQGAAERSLFWQDREFGIWCRARLDWLPDSPLPYGYRMIIADLKTCVSASRDAIAKQVANFSYHIQAAFYVDAVRALGLDDDPAFLLVFVESAPPHLINIAQLDDDAMNVGRDLGREAMERYRDCSQTGEWPGYSAEIELISLPPWTRRSYAEVS